MQHSEMGIGRRVMLREVVLSDATFCCRFCHPAPGGNSRLSVPLRLPPTAEYQSEKFNKYSLFLQELTGLCK